MEQLSAKDEENNSLPSLCSKLIECAKLISSSPSEAVESLTSLQQRVSTLHLFSKNETLQDVATSHIPLLTIEHHLALALVSSPSSSSLSRHSNITRAIDLFHAFLHQLDSMDALEPEIRKEYHHLLHLDENYANDDNINDTLQNSKRPYLGESRENKIARFKLKKAAEDEVSRLWAIHQRRTRLGAEPEEELDGYDDDGIRRNCNLARVHRCSVEAIEEIHTALREIEMLKIAVKMEQQREHMKKYIGDEQSHQQNYQNQTKPSRTQKPIQVTRITQDPTSGNLIFKKEQLKSQVFRPSWNQPTMSLQELADIEVAQAKEREAKQKIAEKEALYKPKRYDQLVRDGLEDNADLVDQSAELDRKWDEFKEANPRGSGNKNADRGDRNF